MNDRLKCINKVIPGALKNEKSRSSGVDLLLIHGCDTSKQSIIIINSVLSPPCC